MLRSLALVALLATVARAQDPTTATAPAAPTPIPTGWSLFMAPAWTTLSGGPSTGSASGGYTGVGYERAWRDRTTLRFELTVGGAAARIGEAGDIFPSPATLQLSRWGVSAGVRRYAAKSAYVGASATLSLPSACWVDLEAGASFYGESIDCPDFTDYRIASAGPALGSSLVAGVRRGRWSAELRYDQGFMPTAETDRGDMTPSSVGAMVEYRFRRPVQAGDRPNIQKPRANAPLPGQLMAGVVGWGAGALAGMAVGAVVAEGSGDGWEPLLYGAMGTFVGTPIGVHLFGARHGVRSNPLATVAGTFVGALGGPAIPFTMPLGAVFGYNAFSRER